jgi:hypothetical protein
MYELKKNGNVFASKCVGTGPSSYENRIYRAAVSQRLRNTAVDKYACGGIDWYCWWCMLADSVNVCVFTYPVSVIAMPHFKASFLEIIPFLISVT